MQTSHFFVTLASSLRYAHLALLETRVAKPSLSGGFVQKDERATSSCTGIQEDLIHTLHTYL